MSRFKEFALPDLGEGLAEGEILRWLVSIGETVELNQPIVEVETAKAAVEIPAKWAGQVAKIFHAEGEVVAVGAPIITIDTEPGSPLPEPSGAGGPGTEAGSPDNADPRGGEPAGGSHGSGRTPVLVGYGPRTGATQRRPRKAAPPPVAQGAPIARPTPTAQPATTARPAPEAGPNPVAQQAGVTGPTPEAGPAGITGPAPMHQPAAGGRVAPAARPAPDARTAPGRGQGARTGPVPCKPPVRKLARDLGVDLRPIVGSGPQGSITRDDVLGVAAARNGRMPATDAPYQVGTETATAVGYPPGPEARYDERREQRVPVKGVRRLTADNMVASAFTAPHVTEFLTVDMTRAMKALDRLRARPEWRDVRVSPLLLVAKAVLLAVRRHPMVNSSWAGDEIVVKEYVNLGIAAATERGLIVPNVKDAGRLTLRQLADELTALTQRAKAGKTTPAEMSGGTLTITNVGVFGVDAGTPILPPGESAILALGTVRPAPWVHRGKVKVRQVTTLGLSFDHRVIDGELGSRFLSDVGDFLTDPEAALLAWC